MRFSCAHIRTSKARQPKQLLTLPRDYYYVPRFHPHRDHLQSVIQDDIKSVPAMSLKINTKLQQSIEERGTSSASDTLLRKDEDYSDASQRVRKQWRKGKWTEEEETYTMKLIEAFIAGVLPLPQGATLRSFLSEKLSCDPMRITKKFAGSNGIGKQVFCQCVPTEKTAELKKRLFREIDELERIFLNKVEANQNISFTVSAKALAFSAKLQMQVQQAPLLISESLATSKSSASGFYRVKRPIDAPTPWASRFDASNTPSISVHPKMSTDNSLYNAPSPYSGSKTETAANPRVGTKRTAEFLTSMESDQELSDDTPTSKRQHEFPAGADLDASSLLLNFFKSKRDVSDLDSDSNESLSETSNRNSETTNSCSTSMPYYSTDGGSLTATGSSSEEDRCLIPF